MQPFSNFLDPSKTFIPTLRWPLGGQTFRWIFFKDIWMIYSDFKWIKILLDMCFVIDDPIVCQIASKWNYYSIKSILHNIRYYPRKCEYNNVSKVNPYSMSRRISRLQDLAFFVEVSIFGNGQKPKSFIGWKMSDENNTQIFFQRLSNFSNDGIKNLKISSGNNDENLSRFSLIITFFWTRIIKS